MTLNTIRNLWHHKSSLPVLPPRTSTKLPSSLYCEPCLSVFPHDFSTGVHEASCPDCGRMTQRRGLSLVFGSRREETRAKKKFSYWGEPRPMSKITVITPKGPEVA